jgi:hypothetical protein
VNDSRFSGLLLDREHVIWSGAPAKGLLFTARDWFLIPFSLIWGGFAVFWEATVINKSAPGFFVLWGVPFVLLGLFFIVGRFIADAWLRNSTRYALTNQRVLIDRSGRFARFTALYLDGLPNIELVRESNGRGTLRFGQPTSMWGRNGFAYWMPSLDPTPQFIAIDDAEHVFGQIQHAIRRRE